MPLANRYLLTAAIALVAVCAGPASSASADRPFTTRYQTHARGNLATAANTLLSCPTATAGCPAAAAGTGGGRQNNNWAMTYVDSDADPTTFNSSSSTLTLPPGATVTFAGLYWGADLTGAPNGAAAPTAAFASTAMLDTPADGGYAQVTGAQNDLAGGLWPQRYQEFADVTDAVADGGAGSYTLANVQAGTGSDRYGGWTLVVAYRAAGEPIRNLSVYDGLATVEGTSSSMVTIDGFETPGTGTAESDLGLVTYEGDYGITGDSVALNGSTLTDAVNPANNFFNSSISAAGARVGTKAPDHVDQLGFDADTVSVDGKLAPGATSADLLLGTTGDTYFVGVITLATDQIPEPPVSGGPPVISGTAEDGQTVTATPGQWSGTDPFEYEYQWQRCDAAGDDCEDIPDANGSSYELGDEDAGNTVRVVVTASNEEGTESATSDASGVVAAVAPSSSGAPSTSGTPQAGEALTADTGSWTGTGPYDFDYQWQRCDAAGQNCVNIPGATGSTYEPTADDVGSTIVVIVTATNPTGSDSVASAPSAPVAAPAQVAPPAAEVPSPSDDGDSGSRDGSRSGSSSVAGLAPTDSASVLNGCQQLTGSQVLAFKVSGGVRFRIRVAPSGRITAARPLRAASPVSASDAWKLNRSVRRVVYKLGSRRIATRRRAPYAVRIGPSMLRRATRQTLTVRVVPKRGKPRVARVQLNSKPCSELFSVVHRPSPGRSLLGLRVDSVNPLRGVVFRVPIRLLAKPGTRGVAGKLRVRVAGRKAMNFRLSFPRTKARTAVLLAGAGRPRVKISGGRITVSGLPAGTAGIRLRLRARGMLRTPRASLRALVQTDGSGRRLIQRLGTKLR